MLIISPIPAASLTPADHALGLAGRNRFECRTCPYQMPLDRKYFERKTMELKQAEDMLGGAESWANVDRAASTYRNNFPSVWVG